MNSFNGVCQRLNVVKCKGRQCFRHAYLLFSYSERHFHFNMLSFYLRQLALTRGQNLLRLHKRFFIYIASWFSIVRPKSPKNIKCLQLLNEHGERIACNEKEKQEQRKTSQFN